MVISNVNNREPIDRKSDLTITLNQHKSFVATEQQKSFVGNHRNISVIHVSVAAFTAQN